MRKQAIIFASLFSQRLQIQQNDAKPTIPIVISPQVLFQGNCSSFSVFKCGENAFKARGNSAEISLLCTRAGKNVGSRAN